MSRWKSPAVGIQQIDGRRRGHGLSNFNAVRLPRVWLGFDRVSQMTFGLLCRRLLMRMGSGVANNIPDRPMVERDGESAIRIAPLRLTSKEAEEGGAVGASSTISVTLLMENSQARYGKGSEERI